MSRICIPDYEYQERIQKAAKMVRERGLDVMLVVSTESDYANARYFSGFWPLFERAGVAISASGDACLLVGPESPIFAKDFGKIEKVFVLKEFRESADPSYPELIPSTFAEAFKSIGVTGENIKIGLGSYVECTLPILDGLKDNFPKAEISYCNDIMPNMNLMDPLVQNLLGFCEKVGMPIIYDGSDQLTGDFGLYDEPGLPQLEHTLQRFPNLIIFGHGPVFWSEIGKLETPGERSYIFDLKGKQVGRVPTHKITEEGVVPKLFRRYPNLRGDLSDFTACNALTRDPEYAAKFIDEFQDKLHFGTDFCFPGIFR